MMFTNIGVRNFKSWLDAAWEPGVGLAPVTAIFGRNSSGKSSLLQPLLLLRQTILSPDPKTVLNFGERGGRDDWIDLGGPEGIWNRRAQIIGDSVKFRIRYPFGDSTSTGLSTADFEAHFKWQFNREVSPRVEQLIYRANGDTFGLKLVPYGQPGQGGYVLIAPTSSSSELDRATPLSAYELEPERAVEFPEPALRALGVHRPRVEGLVAALRSRLDALHYLKPGRAAAPRRFRVFAMPSRLDLDGSNAAQAVLASALEGGDRGVVFNGVSEWLERLNLGAVSRPGPASAPIARELWVTGDTGGDNLLDVGFGVSQVLPVLALGYLAAEGSTVVIEEPETHLHPTAQATLAEYFVEVAKKRSVQFLIETHSEHLFRRFQTLVAKKKASPDDFAFYFVSHTGTHSALERLTIDPFGRVKNWPENFFGDVFGETAIQVREMIDRQGRGE